MSKRKLQIIRSEFPVSGMCDECREVFVSLKERIDAAEMDIKSQFDGHDCKVGVETTS